MPKVSEAAARSLAVQIVRALGAKEEDAQAVADHLIDANLAGHDSHGLVRLAQYASQVADGKIDPAAVPTLETNAGPFALVDGHWSWGQVAALCATKEAHTRAREFGFACVGLRHSPHLGRVGSYALELARAGLVTQVWCNCAGAARVAPWGGTDARLATNPLAIAIPTECEPILMDITTSVVAEGKVRIARNAGRSIPLGWILNRDGAPSTEPADLYSGGTILPLGGEAFGHKGFALSMMCDLLAGVLTGSGCGLMPGLPFANGLLILCFDPLRFLGRAEYESRIQAYVAYLRESPTKEGVDEILMPGEPEARTVDRRKREGLNVDDGTWNELADLARQLNVPLPEVE